ncbi:MAG TPA: 3-carboxy-cis,cis-muconate cycloisomerase [Candidatus Binatia bacterium]|nr:3-carboxy-cis,cis-muconate cycloisomerase [Candidatus Binatia bacterium]
MSASPFDHPLLAPLLGDDEIAGFFTPEAELTELLAFEAALAEAEAAEGVVPPDAATAVAAAARRLKPEMRALAAGVARDGVVVPELVRQLRTAVGEPHAPHVHHGATSQDVIDTGLHIRLRRVSAVIDRRLVDVIERIDGLSAAEGQRTLMGHTRMQRARPITVAEKLSHWREPLARHRERLVELAPRLFLLQLGGAVGNRAELGAKGEAVAERLAKALKLHNPVAARHSERDGVAEFAGWLSLISGSLGKLGADVAMMAQSEVGAVKLANAGGSSAMPEKQNPVAAEVLVALARFNAALVSGMHDALVHENERSGAAWTLEWMILPQMAVATGAALRQAEALLGTLSFR